MKSSKARLKMQKNLIPDKKIQTITLSKISHPEPMSDFMPKLYSNLHDIPLSMFKQ